MFNWLKKLFDNTEPEATGVRARNSKGHFVNFTKIVDLTIFKTTS